MLEVLAAMLMGALMLGAGVYLGATLQAGRLLPRQQLKPQAPPSPRPAVSEEDIAKRWVVPPTWSREDYEKHGTQLPRAGMGPMPAPASSGAFQVQVKK